MVDFKKFFQFRSFRARLTVLMTGLLIIMYALSYLSLDQASQINAMSMIRDSLDVGSRVFKHSMEERQRQKDIARLLSGDYAFKSAYFSHDHATILSATKNHISRVVGADLMMVLALDGSIISDTLHPNTAGTNVEWQHLLDAAEVDPYGESSGIVIIDNQPFLMMVVPLLAPDLEAWISIGFLLDNTFTKAQGGLIHSELSIVLNNENQGWTTVASTLSTENQEILSDTLSNGGWQIGKSIPIEFNGDTYISLITPIIDEDRHQMLAVIQRSLKQELAPFQQLQLSMLLLFSIGLILSALGAALIARTVTKPVKALADGVHDIENGEYIKPVEIAQKDEIGRLASSFNQMAKGLEEREKVRNLLGKVVSNAVAEELLNETVVLGGESRVVTVLFSDARNFTTFCENHSPQTILEVLNRYLSRISCIVDDHHGIVDKYIGDAVMALFGAPISSSDDADNAIRCALAMKEVLQNLNRGFQREGLPQFETGIGINTGHVVAGNIGSDSRLNYTVLGDHVNLASRLEGLTKQYGVPIIVSENTCDAAPNFVYREIDKVRVKGKSQAVKIFEPIGTKSTMDFQSMQEELQQFEYFLTTFRKQQWYHAKKVLKDLICKKPEQRLYQIYSIRLNQYSINPPTPGWDGVHSFNEK